MAKVSDILKVFSSIVWNIHHFPFITLFFFFFPLVLILLFALLLWNWWANSDTGSCIYIHSVPTYILIKVKVSNQKKCYQKIILTVESASPRLFDFHTSMRTISHMQALSFHFSCFRLLFYRFYLHFIFSCFQWNYWLIWLF